MKEILLRAPATTANVGPGYDIFALSLNNPHDEILVRLNDSGKITLETTDKEAIIPLNIQDNTAGLAARFILEKYHIKTGVNIKIIKKMPSGCGLGTTGASASATIFGLNKLLNLNLSDDEMIDIARRGEVASGGSPHADNVAAALLGGFVLVKSYNPVEVLKLEIPEFPLVLAIMRKNQRTTRGFITYDIGVEKLREQIAHCSTIIHAIHTKDIVEFGKAVTIDYLAEPVRGAAIPNYFETKKELLNNGAYGCNISGGGSSVFAVCDEENQDKLAEIMEKSFASNPNFIKIIKTKMSNKGVKIIG